jgi:3-oxoacyl-[acyl-carrier-protein] synthase II
MPDRTRVVITGMGAVTPLGVGVQPLWDGLLSGVSGIAPIAMFDASAFACRIGGECRDFDPAAHLDKKAVRRMSRFSQLAVVAAGEAVQDADLALDDADRERVGVILGNGNGGFPDIEATCHTLFERGGMRIQPTFLPKILPNMAAANIAMHFGLGGYNTTVVTACAAGTQAIGEAADIIRTGRADIVLAGGTESGFSPLGMGGFAVMRALTSRSDEPTRASRPFDADRDGFVPAEGAGVLVMESEAHARARGARIRAELAGFGSSADAFHLVMPDETGAGPGRAARWALDDAGLAPEAVDYVNAHGTSTPLNDAAETRVLKALLGEAAYRTPVSSTKSMIGHAFGAGGAIETIASVRTIETGIIHPTINLDTPDPDCDLDYVPNEARKADVRVVLKNSFGFGGQNACLVLRRYD